MEKKYMIFYYDVDEEGIPVLSLDMLQDVTNSLVELFKDKNIDCIILPNCVHHSNEKTREEVKSFLISYLNKILALERKEAESMTKEEAKKEVIEYLQEADKCISEDEEYIRGWKCAMTVALEILEKLD